MDDLTKEFLAESLEGLDRMERCLTELESSPEDAELLAEIFRAVHTIKGTTGFLGFDRLEKLAHTGENLLGGLREGRLQATPDVISGLLALLDGLRIILQLIETTGTEGVRSDDEDSALVEELKRLNADTATMPALVSTASPSAAAGAAARPSTSVSTGFNDKTLRIEVEVLNRMMNLVGELVLTRNQILQSSTAAANFPVLARRLDAVTADLRESVMQARMQPVGHLFGKFPRMVRDLAKACGKQVRLEFSGQETGLDKSLLEAIKDPLAHAVRNAVDHGLEGPEARLLAGKTAEGVVSLKACHHSGSVVIEVVDDGAGISRARVIAKAVERTLISVERAASLSDAEALQLIFLPGFSTASEVTSISGRGVGMDVVRSNVEKAGGTVEVQSVEGQGTVLRLRVPLTLAIVPALIVESGGESFCLPQAALAELVYVPEREAEQQIERIGEAEVFRLRDSLLPIVWLDRMLGLDGAASRSAERGVRSEAFYLAVLEADGCRFGLAVDNLLSPEEIVVKPLSAVLRGIGVFSGATVLGNGTLAMILDVAATALRSGVRPVVEKIALRAAAPEQGAVDADTPAFLIFDQPGVRGLPQRYALPLSAVERIESVALHEIEYASGRPILQYRGETLPLQDESGLLEQLGVASPDATATVLICRRPGAHAAMRMGMVVGQVLDVSNGTLMAEDPQLSDTPLALIRERLTALHRDFVPMLRQAPAMTGSWRSAA